MDRYGTERCVGARDFAWAYPRRSRIPCQGVPDAARHERGGPALVAMGPDFLARGGVEASVIGLARLSGSLGHSVAVSLRGGWWPKASNC